jgi:uncharacterized membrane protein YecN with MAPEG domain
MIRVFQLFFSPIETWQRIDETPRGVGGIFALSVLPLMLLSTLAEGYGLTHWGVPRGELGRVTKVSLDLALHYGLTQLALGVVMLFFGALFIRWIGDGFHTRIPYTACFKATAYALTPVFLARFLDAVPAINTWVCWAIGAAGTVSVLYHGVGLVLKPDQTKGFGMYLLCAVFLVLMSGLAHFVALAVLQEKLKLPGIG